MPESVTNRNVIGVLLRRGERLFKCPGIVSTSAPAATIRHGQLGPGGEHEEKLGLTMILGWAEWSAGARSRKAEEQRAFLGTNDYIYNLGQEERSWSLDLV